jgi:hypothetical protein
MAHHSANGSKITVGAVDLHCRMTRVRKGARLTETTHSGTSSSVYQKVVKDHSWSLSVPWDDTNLPDTDVGLNEGDVVTITFTMGGSGKTEVLTGTTVESLEDIMDSAGDIIRTEVSGKGGVITRPVT